VIHEPLFRASKNLILRNIIAQVLMTWKIVDNFLFVCFNIAMLFSEETSQCHYFVKVAHKLVLSVFTSDPYTFGS